MNSRERFRETMNYGRPDRVPLFEEGIRDEVLETWREQGLPVNKTLSEMFAFDRREEIDPDLQTRPWLHEWPADSSQLDEVRRALDPADPGRLPTGWQEHVRVRQEQGDVLMLRAQHGFFQSMGVSGWKRFQEVIYLLLDDPGLVREIMAIKADFTARLAEKILAQVKVDAAVFSEPISGNDGPLISPQMYQEFVLPSYRPLLKMLRRHGVKTIILRTYANARGLLPAAVESGFNCLWACECNSEAMDLAAIRREFGTELRLIGGIDVDALRENKETIRRELEEKVPPLLAGGGYVPLADGRVRAEIPFENYVFYRTLLEKLVEGESL